MILSDKPAADYSNRTVLDKFAVSNKNNVELL